MVTKYAQDESISAFTGFGSPYFYIFVLALFWFMDHQFAIFLLGQMLTIEVLGSLIKLVYYKERPLPLPKNSLLQKFNATSFPSMHMARICGLLFPLATLYANVVFLIGCIVLACLVGLSRIKSKRHYLMDVVAGAMLAGIVSVAYFSLLA